MDQSSISRYQCPIVAPPRRCQIKINRLWDNSMTNDTEYCICQHRLRLAHCGESKRIDNVAGLHQRVLLREHSQAFCAALEEDHVSGFLVGDHAPHTHLVPYRPLRRETHQTSTR